MFGWPEVVIFRLVEEIRLVLDDAISALRVNILQRYFKSVKLKNDMKLSLKTIQPEKVQIFLYLRFKSHDPGLKLITKRRPEKSITLMIQGSGICVRLRFLKAT